MSIVVLDLGHVEARDGLVRRSGTAAVTGKLVRSARPMASSSSYCAAMSDDTPITAPALPVAAITHSPHR